jgi:hypothetical protein
MVRACKALVGMGLVIGMVGCQADRMDQYARERPSVDSTDRRDSGLQSKDVIGASETLARDLLALRELRQSPELWTMVVDRIQDSTIDRDFRYNYDIFIERMRSVLSEHGNNQIRLIDNKRTFDDIRSRELDSESDRFQQGGRSGSGANPVQPQYALYGKAFDMPNRGTNYYMIQFDVVNLDTREQVWSRKYEVKVAR